MAFNSTHWDIDYTLKTVTNVDGGASLPHDASGTLMGEIIEFFQWLATEFASTGQMDDSYPIVSDTPTVYKWINGWGFGDEDNDYKYLKGGDITSSDGLEFWASVYTIGAPVAGSQIYITQADTEIPVWWYTDNIDVLIKVKTGGTYTQSVNTAGVLTDGGVWLYIREYGDYFNHGFVDLSGGRSPIGLDTSEDTANATAQATVGAYGVSIGAWGTYSRDLNNGAGAQDYDVEVDCNGLTMDEVYEYLKWSTSYAYDVIINGDDGQEYRSADEGTYAEVKAAPFGTIAGGTLYGARGIWFTNYAAANFVLIDSAGVTQNPPNYQVVRATHPDLDGTISTDGGVNIFVAEISAGLIVKDQYVFDQTSSDATHLHVTLDINANKTPLSGIVRIGDTRYVYTSFTGKIFTVTTDPTGETDASDTYVPFLDVLADAISESSANIVQAGGDIDIRTSVRRYGTKPYDVDTTFTATGRTFTPILAEDPQAS